MTDAAETKEPLIRAENVSVAFGKHVVLRNVTLEIARGETVAIVGESGCGKTLLLKSLIGLLRPNSGHVTFDGKVLQKLDFLELTKQRLRMGFVFQQAALFDSMNVFENIAFGLREHTPSTEAQIRAAVKDRLHEVGLSTDIVARMPVELSGGMRKRVGLARALALQPEVMLYDEPTTGLDPIMSDVINELVLRTRRRYPVTSVVVTHDMRAVMKVADRVVMLYSMARLKAKEPQVVFSGTPEELQATDEPRVRQFVRGEAGDRMMEGSAP
jgi:phospholipid/cholesterol/gamma-HCH transport system ATP-binding protein